MRVVAFNEAIYEVLIRCGFRYCYAKTVADDASPGQVKIFLTPVGSRPNIRQVTGPI